MIDIDVIGTIYTPGAYDAEGNELAPAVALDGYHVNATYPVADWLEFKVTPEAPRRVFGGHETHFYTFADVAEYESMLATSDLSVPVEASQPVPDQQPVVSQSITRAQAKLALLGAGLLDLVQPAIDAVIDPTQRASMQIEWDDRLTFERNNPTLIALATGLGMTNEQLDQLFITASNL